MRRVWFVVGILISLYALLSLSEVFDVLYGDTSQYPFGIECAGENYRAPDTYLAYISKQTALAVGAAILAFFAAWRISPTAGRK